MTLLKACVNGARSASEHQALPMTPAQLASDAIAVAAAGAGAVHLHVKDSTGADTLAAAPLTAALEAVRGAAPDLPIGVTTGAWAQPDPAQRVAAIQSWTELPDFASVNWHEEGAEEVAAALLDRSIGVEAGLWTISAIELFAQSALKDRCLRILIELPDGLTAAETETNAEEMVQAARTTNSSDLAILLHGEGTSTWPAVQLAARWNLATRVGLEDTLALPHGEVALNNAALITAARTLMAAA